MKNRKAQVAVIIIIAILIIGIIITLFVFREKLTFKLENKIPEINEINNALKNCLNQRSIDAIYLIGLQGGYAETPKDYIETEISKIAYGLKDNKNILISQEEIEKEISNYLKLTMPFCLNEEDYLQLEINQDNQEIEVDIHKNNVKIISKPLISIKKDDKSYTLNKKYETEIPIRLGEMHDTANDIIKKHLEESNFIDISYLTSLEHDIVFTPFDDQTLIYTITDSESKINEIPYSFMFGVEAKWRKK